MFQIQEFVGEAGKVCHIDEETAYGEDGLVVWQGRVAKCSEIPGLVYEASMQRRSSKRNFQSLTSARLSHNHHLRDTSLVH